MGLILEAKCLCLCFLGESNSQMVSLTEELSQKNEDLMKQQEEISQLLLQIVELQQRLKQVRNVEEVGRQKRDRQGGKLRVERRKWRRGDR